MRPTRYRFGEFELDPASRGLWRSGERIALPLKSLECLAYLIAHRERAVAREELIAAVWGRADVSDTLIAQTMRRARKALDDAGNRQALVRTVAGFGYRWVAPVEEIDVPGAPADAVPANAVPIDPGPEVQAREATPPPAAERAATRARRLRAAAAAAVLAVVVVATWWWSPPSPKRDPATAGGDGSDDRVMILPVAVESGGQDLEWMRLGGMAYAADRLRAGKLKVAPTEQTPGGESADGWTIDPARLPSDTNLRQVLEDSSVDWLLVPRLQQDSGGWRVQLRVFDRRSDLNVEARDTTPLGAMAVATDAWLRQIGRTPPDLAAPGPIIERLQHVDVELAAGQLEAAREQILQAPVSQRDDPRMQVREGQVEYRTGRIDQAEALFEKALAANADATDVATRARGLLGLGSVALRRQQFDAAENRYTQALDALEGAGSDVGNGELLGNAYNGRGVARMHRNDMEGAVADMGLARFNMRQNGDLVSAAMVGTNIGRIETILGHWSRAMQEFDRSIDVFERYQVRGYLAATLASKANAQLMMAQGAEALATVEQGRALSDAIQDPFPAHLLATTRVRALLVNGRLDDAEAALQGLSREPDVEGVVAGLSMALALSRGDHARAARLAAHLPPSTTRTDDGVVMMAVQAAGNVADARAWRGLIATSSPVGPQRPGIAPILADAIIERRFGNHEAALAAAIEATTRANRDGSQDDRIRAGVVRALLLLESGQPQDASAVLGQLDAYATTDYRVAWLAWSIYRHSDNAALARRTQAQAEALCGQRSLADEPVL